MAQTATNVSAAKPRTGGALYTGALGTTPALPTTADAALASGFTSLGYISEDGVTNSNALEIEDIRAWGGDVVLSTMTGKEDTFSLTLIEAMNVDVLKAVFGASAVSGTLSAGIAVNVSSAEHTAAKWVIDMILKDGKLKRITIPNGKISAIEDITYSDSAAIGYGITITAMPDASGNTHYEYIKAPAST